MKTNSNNPANAAAGASHRRLWAVLSWAAVIALAAFIFYMSAQSGEDLDEHTGIISIVKAWLANCAVALFGHSVDVSPVGHFGEYLLLGAALANALRFTPWTHTNGQRQLGAIGSFPIAFIALCLASLYGVTDEFHQIFTPDRACDVADWLVDTAAASLGALAVWLWSKR